MYIYIHICTYAYAFTHIYIYLCACVCIYIYVSEYMYLCKCVYVNMYLLYITLAWSPLLQVSILKPRSADDRDVRMTLLSIPGDACP